MARSLARELESLLGKGKVVADPDIVKLYSRNPLGVEGQAEALALPGDVRDLSRIAAWAYEKEVPLYPEGSTTELAGSTTPEGGVIISFQTMNRIREVNIVDGYIVAEAGARLIEVNAAVEPSGYMFPVDPASWKAATVGGAVNTGAGGMRGVKYGTMREWVSGLKIVLADPRGTILDIGCRTVKCRQGYDLVRLIVGSEGTLALVAEATLRITPMPENLAGMLAFFPSLDGLMEAVIRYRENGIQAFIMEFMDSKTVDISSGSLGAGYEGLGNALIVVVDVPREAADRYVSLLEGVARDSGASKVYTARSTEEIESMGILELRRRFFPASLEYARRKLGGKVLAFIEDVAVPPSRLPEAVRRIRESAQERGLDVVIGGHVGDGNLHPKTWVKPGDPRQARLVEEWFHEVMKIAVELGGTVSAEHGIGRLKRRGLAMELEARGSLKALELMAQIKRVFDPKGILNPGKVL